MTSFRVCNGGEDHTCNLEYDFTLHFGRHNEIFDIENKCDY